MTHRIRAALCCALLAAGLAPGCNRTPASKPAKQEPAAVEHHIDEASLNRVTLAEQAVQRLGIQLAEVKLSDIRRKRTVGGEVVLPPGKSIVVSAPIAGTLSAPPAASQPVPGARVAARQPIFSFKPLLTPERDVLTPSERVRVAQTKADVATIQIEAARQIESAKLTVQAAQIVHDRAAQMLQSKAGSQRSLDEAAVQLKLAQEALTTAEARNRFLSGIQLDEQAGELATRVVESPVAGVLQSIEAAEGETVVPGEPLFSVITTNRVWIRVPIYVGQWRDIDTQAPAQIVEFGAGPGTAPLEATHVAAPPAADPQAATVDVIYALDNRDGQLYPGQKVAATVPLQGQKSSLAVPLKAILYDIHGGAWVYQQLQPRVYARRRVSLEYVDGDTAVLVSGPEAGSQVVTDGAAELFGAEFGVGH